MPAKNKRGPDFPASSRIIGTGWLFSLCHPTASRPRPSTSTGALSSGRTGVPPMPGNTARALLPARGLWGQNEGPNDHPIAAIIEHRPIIKAATMPGRGDTHRAPGFCLGYRHKQQALPRPFCSNDRNSNRGLGQQRSCFSNAASAAA